MNAHSPASVEVALVQKEQRSDLIASPIKSEEAQPVDGSLSASLKCKGDIADFGIDEVGKSAAAIHKFTISEFAGLKANTIHLDADAIENLASHCSHIRLSRLADFLPLADLPIPESAAI